MGNAFAFDQSVIEEAAVVLCHLTKSRFIISATLSHCGPRFEQINHAKRINHAYLDARYNIAGHMIYVIIIDYDNILMNTRYDVSVRDDKP